MIIITCPKCKHMTENISLFVKAHRAAIAEQEENGQRRVAARKAKKKAHDVLLSHMRAHNAHCVRSGDAYATVRTHRTQRVLSPTVICDAPVMTLEGVKPNTRMVWSGTVPQPIKKHTEDAVLKMQEDTIVHAFVKECVVEVAGARLNRGDVWRKPGDGKWFDFLGNHSSALKKQQLLAAFDAVIGDKFGQGKYIERERKYRGLRWKCGSVAGVEV